MDLPFGRIEDGWTLPPSLYLDQDTFDRELDVVIGRTWQYVGPVDWVAVPGDYMTCQVGRVPVVVARDRAGALGAFVNVCRHRSSKLVEGRGRVRAFNCRYHAWTYDLDGALIAAPRAEEGAAFPKGDLGLLKLRVGCWGPMVFVATSPQVLPLEQVLGGLPDLYAAAGLDLGRVRWRDRREYPMRVNWKVATENILECYHCPLVHPDFARVMDLEEYRFEDHESYVVQRTGLRGRSADDAGTYDTRGHVREGIYAFVWPNFMANTNPGPGMFHTNHVRPVDRGAMVMVNDFYFGDDIGVDEARRYVDFQDKVSREDIDPVESVQAGLASRAVPQGRLVPSQERHIQYFMTRVARALEPGNQSA